MQELGFPKRINTMRLVELLRQKYPDKPWENIYLQRGKYALQKRLERAISLLFPVPFISLYLFSFCLFVFLV
jgi:hypothetical protein